MATGSFPLHAQAVLLLVGLGLGMAGWLLPASLHIVSWQDGAAGRIALVPTLWDLVWSAAVGVVGSQAVGWWWRRSGKPATDLVRLVSPWLLVWLWLLPFVPWLGGQVPVFLVLAGPARWVVVALALMGSLVVAYEVGWLRVPHISWPNRGVVFAASVLIFLGVGQYVKRIQGFGGDEPHYLVITHSLWVDHDLQIENNHRERDYWAFHPGDLPMHYLARGRDDIVYSIHAPGLPALMIPGYAIAGHWGALVTVGLIAALAALAIFDVAALVASPPVALATWAGVTMTIPFGLQSWLIFPEMPAALLMAWVTLWVWREPSDRVGVWIWRGAVLSLLPWLHMKFSLLLFVSGLWLAWCLWPRVRLVLAFLVPIGVSGLLWLGSFWVMYGDINPTVAYGYAQGAELDWLNIPRGMLGLTFDQEYGLLPYSPIFAMSLLGAWHFARRKETRAYVLGAVCVIGPFLASTTQYYMWWGGGSVPARFIVPVLPLLAPMLAIAMRERRYGAPAGCIALVWGYSVAVFVVVVLRPAAMLMYNDRDGTGHWLETLQGGAPLTASLPSFIDPDILVQLPPTLVWVVAAAGAAWLAARLTRREVPVGFFWGGMIALGFFGASGSVLAAAVLPEPEPTAVVADGRQRLLEVFPDRGLRPFGYTARRWLREEEVFDVLVLEARLEQKTDRAPPDPTGLGGPFDLPAGRYDLLVWFTRPQAVEGQVVLSYDRTAGTVASGNGRTMNPAVIPFELPVGLSALRIAATSAPLAEMVSGVAIAPRQLISRDERLDPGRIRAVKPVGQRLGAYLLFMDENTFVEPELNWVRGGHATRVLVSTGDATALRVIVRNGGVANRIVTSAGDRYETYDLDAWETRELRVAVVPGEGVVPVTVTPERGFVPAEVEPGSNDTRVLGCTVTVVLD